MSGGLFSMALLAAMDWSDWHSEAAARNCSKDFRSRVNGWFTVDRFTKCCRRKPASSAAGERRPDLLLIVPQLLSGG